MTRVPEEPKAPELRAWYWREEILEVILWLRGEGFDEHIGARALREFLDMDAEHAAAHLDELVAQGYLNPLPDGRYALTDRGESEADRLLRGTRIVPKPAAGPCGPACWCHTSPVESAACLTNQIG